jgi:hypothetical protein
MMANVNFHSGETGGTLEGMKKTRKGKDITTYKYESWLFLGDGLTLIWIEVVFFQKKKQDDSFLFLPHRSVRRRMPERPAAALV